MTTPATGMRITKSASPEPPKRRYVTPRLTVHGTVTELTASNAADVLAVSLLTGG